MVPRALNANIRNHTCLERSQKADSANERSVEACEMILSGGEHQINYERIQDNINRGKAEDGAVRDDLHFEICNGDTDDTREIRVKENRIHG